MSVENGEWIMFGTKEDDPDCIHNVKELISYINEVGFLPLFRNQIPRFSVEERTVPDYWWSGNKEKDPWEWREIIAESGAAAYGKFYDGKAGFVSREWLPYFANVRRDGYDFDSLWEDGKTSRKQKKIMDLFLEENEGREYYSNELKEKAGYGKDGEKGFDGVMTSLQMQTYLVVRDFKQRKNKKGDYYGWPIGIYATPEHMFGAEHVTSAYREEPVDSAKRIAAQVLLHFSEATEKDIRRIVLGEKGIRKEKKSEKKVEYPANLIKALELYTEDGSILTSLNADQMIGLEYASYDVSTVFNKVLADPLHKKSIDTVGDLVVTIASDPMWYRSVNGIGENYHKQIVKWLWNAGIEIEKFRI